jgi:3-deoxy-7-phosphoheptulonate synthase
MIIQLEKNINDTQLANIFKSLESVRLKPNEVSTPNGRYIIATGKGHFDIRKIGSMKGVMDIHRVKDAFKLVSRQWKVHDSVIDLGDGVKIGDGHFSIVSGPCSIESIDHGIETIQHLHKNNIRIMRAMVFKPRTSPYAFRGIGLEGLKEISNAAKEHGIKINSEVLHPEDIDAMLPYVDIFQVGARNAQNYTLLDALGKTDKVIILKRGMSQTIDEWLHAAEYIFSNGNEKIVFCERGIRSFENAYRNTFDLNAIPVMQEKTHLPVIADPSHAIGIRRFVPSMALAAIMAGADGILMETHAVPQKAVSDAAQTLSYQQAEELYIKMCDTYQHRQALELPH